jgi:toxin FitB
VTTPSDSEPVVIDSSGWLEYLTADEKADLFAPYFEQDVTVLVPVIVLYEVRKILLLKESASLADIFLSDVSRRKVVEINENIAIFAATISVDHQLAMADAFLYATARSCNARFVTSDAHFKDLPGVTLL